MKRSHNAFLSVIVFLTLLLCGVIIWILLFRQSAVPQFNIPEDGKDGQSATVEQIYEAVTQYFTKNPPEKGQDGTPVSREQIALVVAEYLQAHPPAPGKDGETIVGADGNDGSSCTTTQVEGGAVITCTDGSSSFISNGTNGVDGRTPFIRCNTNKNRWEIRYSEEDLWVAIKDQNNNSAKCSTVL